MLSSICDNRRRAHAAFSLAVGVPDFNALTSGLIAPAWRSDQLLVLVAEGEIQDGVYSVLLEVRIGGSDLMAPALAILIQFSGLFLDRSMISVAACFCSSMEHEEESRCDIGSNRQNSQRCRRGRVVGSRSRWQLKPLSQTNSFYSTKFDHFHNLILFPSHIICCFNVKILFHFKYYFIFSMNNNIFYFIFFIVYRFLIFEYYHQLFIHFCWQKKNIHWLLVNSLGSVYTR